MYKKVMLLLLLVIGLTSANAYGVLYWASGANGNWNDNIWGGGTPGAGDTAYINVGSTVTIDGTAEEVAEFHHASWSGNSDPVTLHIINGGSLTVDGWAYLGVSDGDVGVINIDSASTLTSIGPLNVGYNGDCTLNVNGGTVNAVGDPLPSSNGGFFCANLWQATGSGTVNLLAGTINVGTPTTYTDFVMNAEGLINIEAGKIRIYGLWWDATINGYIGGDQIIGYDGLGTVNIGHEGDYTIISATHPYQPNPAMDEVVTAGPYTMSWVLPEPNETGGTVNCSVYLNAGEPNFMDPAALIVDNQSVSSVGVTLEDNKTYYWRVDVNDLTAPGIVIGDVFRFYTGNQPPVVDAGADVLTWLDGGTATADLLATIIEDDGMPVSATVLWEVVTEPSAGAATISPVSADQLDITVTFSEGGSYVLRVTASDTELSDSDEVAIWVSSDSCQAAKDSGIPLLAGDIDENCKVDIADFAAMAVNWLDDISLE